MTVICPVTGKKCPYDQKLDSGVCPREHECDIIRAEYSMMIKKPPSPRKKIYISAGAVLILVVAVLLYFFVFDGNLDFLSRKEKTAENTQTPPPVTETSIPQPTSAPTAAPTPEPSQLPAVPVTNEDPMSVVRLTILGTTYKVKNVGLDSERKIEAYPDAAVISWYEGSYLPGGAGNSILFGFKYYGGVSGAFYSLETLSSGDSISFTLDNGTTMELEVMYTQVYDRNNIPSTVFELETTSPHTVLITQYGSIDPLTNDYTDMLVVFLK